MPDVDAAAALAEARALLVRAQKLCRTITGDDRNTRCPSCGCPWHRVGESPHHDGCIILDIVRYNMNVAATAREAHATSPIPDASKP